MPKETRSDADDVFGDARAAGYGSARLAMFALFDGPVSFLKPKFRPFALTWQVLITVCILTSICTFVVSSLAAFWGTENTVLGNIEIVVVTVFTADYVCRFFLTPYPRFALPYSLRCGAKSPRERATSRELRTGFVWQFLNIIDVLSVLPFYVELIVAAASNGDMSGSTKAFAAVRVLRLFRLPRVLKVGKYIAILRDVGETLRRSMAALGLLVFSVLVAGLLYGSLEFYAENLSGCTFNETSQTWTYIDSGEPSPYQSVLHGIWWAIVTITTVGYGDKFPVTWPGQVVALFAVLNGLVVLAFPITIISSNFSDVTSEAETERDEKELVANINVAAVGAQFSDLQLVDVLKSELRKQADAINKLQDTVEDMARRWRAAESALHLFEQRVRKDDMHRLGESVVNKR